MKLKQLCPDMFLSAGAEGIQALLRTVIMRPNFVPGIRHVIGWRGLKQTVGSVDGWTAKIKDHRGIFGIYPDDFVQCNEWSIGKFALLYFPDPKEALVELSSLQAGAFTQREDYLEQVRNFLRDPVMCELFHIGIIELGINPTDNGVILRLESMSSQRVVAIDGIIAVHKGREVELIKPGGFDQNFPSYDTALAFYKVLAASLTFNLEKAPVYMHKGCRPGKIMTYDTAGRHRGNPSDEVCEVSLSLGYGQADFEGVIEKRQAKGADHHQHVTWMTGRAVPTEFNDAGWWHAHQISDYRTLDKKILGIDDRPQLIVLTGFLGAGKTSFLQHFIEYQVQKSRFVAVVQNEIGEVGLDAKLLDDDYAVTEIDEGCICCTLVGNLKKAIQQILSSFHPDYIVLETTGLANPYNLLDEIAAIEDLVKFDCVATIVDGTNVSRLAARYETVKDQIRAADILLVNKMDLFGASKLESVKKDLRRLNPNVPIITCRNGDVNPSLLFAGEPHEHPGENDSPSAKCPTGLCHLTHALDGFVSMKVDLPHPMQKEEFLRFVDNMPASVFRMKGVVDFVDYPTTLVFQYVAGRHDFSEFSNPGITDRFLVIIGQNLPKDDLRKLFNESINQSTSPVLRSARQTR